MKEQLALAQSLVTAEQLRFLEQHQLSLEDFLRGGMRGVWQDREHAYQSIFQDWNGRLGQRTFARTWEMLHSEEQEKLLITHVLHWPILRSEEEEIAHYPTAYYSTYYQHLYWLVCKATRYSVTLFRGEKQAMAQARLLSEAVVIAALRFEQIISDTGIVLVD